MNPFDKPVAKAQGGTVMKIFLCDDQIRLRELMKDCLEGVFPSVSIEEGSDGSQAVAAARENVYDLILLDVDMPNMTGFEALEQIRKESLNEKTPIVMLTGRTTEEDLQKGLTLGADSYITKPFDLDLIEEEMKELFGSKTSR